MGRPPYTVADFWAKVEKTPTCWLWKGSTFPSGYGRITIGRKYSRAHRLSYELTKRPLPKGALVFHTCDVRLCVNPDHLWAGVNDENMQDMVAKGRTNQGPDHHESKFSAKDIRRVFESYASGKMSRKALAKKYGVWEATIHQILTRTRYLNVPIEPELRAAVAERKRLVLRETAIANIMKHNRSVTSGN